MEEALYDLVAMRAFVGIDLRVEGAPDETTVCKFRHLLERNKLSKVLLTAVNDQLHRSGIKIAKGAYQGFFGSPHLGCRGTRALAAGLQPVGPYGR